MWRKARVDDWLGRIPLIMLGTIFVAEASIMTVFALAAGEQHSRWLEVVVDSSVLTLVVAPILHRLIVRPLRQLADERSRLLAHVLEVQDTERRQIARDLHDEIGQSFTSLLVQMRLLEDAPTLEAAQARIRELRELSGAVYDQIRGLARGLHPAILDDLGLVQAVERLAEEFEATYDATVAVDVRGMPQRRFDRKLENAAYRIVQESLTNCAKYAQATHVRIVLSTDAHELLVTVSDDGRGFDASAPAGAEAATVGLASMRERALLLEGSFTIESRPGGGTTVTARLPLGT